MHQRRGDSACHPSQGQGDHRAPRPEDVASSGVGVAERRVEKDVRQAAPLDMQVLLHDIGEDNPLLPDAKLRGLRSDVHLALRREPQQPQHAVRDPLQYVTPRPEGLRVVLVQLVRARVDNLVLREANVPSRGHILSPNHVLVGLLIVIDKVTVWHQGQLLTVAMVQLLGGDDFVRDKVLQKVRSRRGRETHVGALDRGRLEGKDLVLGTLGVSVQVHRYVYAVLADPSHDVARAPRAHVQEVLDLVRNPPPPLGPVVRRESVAEDFEFRLVVHAEHARHQVAQGVVPKVAADVSNLQPLVPKKRPLLGVPQLADVEAARDNLAVAGVSFRDPQGQAFREGVGHRMEGLHGRQGCASKAVLDALLEADEELVPVRPVADALHAVHVIREGVGEVLPQDESLAVLHDRVVVFAAVLISRGQVCVGLRGVWLQHSHLLEASNGLLNSPLNFQNAPEIIVHNAEPLDRHGREQRRNRPVDACVRRQAALNSDAGGVAAYGVVEESRLPQRVTEVVIHLREVGVDLDGLLIRLDGLLQPPLLIVDSRKVRQGHSVLPVHAHHLGVAPLRLVELLHLGVAQSQARVRLCVPGLELEYGLVARDGPRILLLLPPELRQADPGGGVLLVVPDGLQVVVLGHLPPVRTLAPPQVSQVAAHHVEGRVDVQREVVALDGLRHLPLLNQQAREVVVRVRERGLEVDGVPVVHGRQVQVPGFLQRVRQVGVGLGQVRLQSDGLPRVNHALVVVLQLVVDRAQEEQDVRPLRLRHVSGVAVRQGVREVSRLVELVRGSKHVARLERGPALLQVQVRQHTCRGTSVVDRGARCARGKLGTPRNLSERKLVLLQLSLLYGHGHHLRCAQLQRINPVHVPRPVVRLERQRGPLHHVVPRVSGERVGRERWQSRSGSRGVHSARRARRHHHRRRGIHGNPRAVVDDLPVHQIHRVGAHVHHRGAHGTERARRVLKHGLRHKIEQRKVVRLDFHGV
mmetsp:Transcript_16053/g.45975  ORF Transcript_16053/g.45975 Transcript_16053/m.45975 type:complete len:978 (-) Transcript_16053:302-3235(-)